MWGSPTSGRLFTRSTRLGITLDFFFLRLCSAAGVEFLAAITRSYFDGLSRPISIVDEVVVDGPMLVGTWFRLSAPCVGRATCGSASKNLPTFTLDDIPSSSREALLTDHDKSDLMFYLW